MPKKKPTNGQISLIGEYYMLGVKYPPKVSRDKNGLAVVVTRIPPDASAIDIAMSRKASTEMAKNVKSIIPSWKR